MPRCFPILLIGLDLRQGHDLSCGEPALHRGRTGGLHTHHAYLFSQGAFQAQGHARHQPATANGHDDHFDLRPVLQQLQAHGACTRHGPGPIVRMDEHQPLGRQLFGVLVGAQPIAAEHNLCPQFAARFNLVRIGVAWHDDGGLDARPLGRPRQGPAMVAGAAGHDPAFALLGSELGDVVPGPSGLEGPAHLTVLQLGAQAQALVGGFRRQLNGHQGCALHNPIKTRGSRLKVQRIEGGEVGGHGRVGAVGADRRNCSRKTLTCL